MPKKKKRRNDLEVELDIDEGKEIIILTNPLLYWLDYVLIVFEEAGYRLVVSSRRRIVTDQWYQDVRGAKIAFLKFHQFRAASETLKPVWSERYAPDRTWLEHRINGIME